MRDVQVRTSDKRLPTYEPNIARMLEANWTRFTERPMYQEPVNGAYVALTWQQLRRDLFSLQQSLKELGLRSHDRVAILSRNRREMLEIELVIMAMGAVAVPIFAGFNAEQADAMVRFCEPTLVVAADQSQVNKISAPQDFRAIIHFDAVEGGGPLVSFNSLLQNTSTADTLGDRDVPSETVSLMMYTSGTMGKPKCVQLTHGNILSQQAALRTLWEMTDRDRFLSYLPWHHSFGGIFEKYAAITNGALLSLEDGYGKDIDRLLHNWKLVRPTVFFSVPRVYQDLVARTVQNPEAAEIVFHSGLRFIFTAAAPLPAAVASVFKSHNIPIVEGWGLTETSPCCTVTDPTVTRDAGVVGHPIPGVSLMLDTDGEILVKGPNVMRGYYNNPEATQAVLMDDGWFRTGDVGEFTENGLRLISRKDRIFKLSNAEKVVPSEVENRIVGDCAFLSYALVTGSGRDYPVALLFPNRSMFNSQPDESRLKFGCKCPPDLQTLSCCLANCLALLNQNNDVRYSRLQSALLLDYELTIDNEELTPSMKLSPNKVADVFKARIEQLYGDNPIVEDDVYIIKLPNHGTEGTTTT